MNQIKQHLEKKEFGEILTIAKKNKIEWKIVDLILDHKNVDLDFILHLVDGIEVDATVVIKNLNRFKYFNFDVKRLLHQVLSFKCEDVIKVARKCKVYCFDKKMFLYLLTKVDDINYIDKIGTNLILAYCAELTKLDEEDKKIVKLMIEKGININYVNPRNITILHKAVFNKNLDLVNILIDNNVRSHHT